MSHPWLWFFSVLLCVVMLMMITGFEVAVAVLKKYEEDLILKRWIVVSIKIAFWIAFLSMSYLLIYVILK